MQAVAPIRESDGTGRHTTTSRQLIGLPGGALLIDTPGMRELQPWADESAIDGVFADIAEIAQSCRFGDCSHSHEPGCAVVERSRRAHSMVKGWITIAVLPGRLC